MKYFNLILNKNIKASFSKIILLPLILLIVSSCQKDVLETKALSQLTEDVVWNDPAIMETFISRTYRAMPNGFQFQSRRIFCVSDESKARVITSYSVVNAGNITPSELGPLDYWIGSSARPGYYEAITQSNLFLQKIEESDFEFDAELKNRMVGEMKTLRAFAYFRLISFFGGVPLITEPFGLEDDFNLPRTSYEDCMDYVIKELDEAMSLLPSEYDAESQGRVTQGAAMAIKSRALLYAASPLNNPSNDLEKWKKASDAAKAVIDLNKYQLFPDYKGMFQEANNYNSEMIWERPFNRVLDYETVYFELRFYPIGDGGYGQINPLQNLVDQYETLNGLLPINDPTFDSQNPFVNRDPRFYATILHDGAIFKDREIETFLPGGIDTKDGPIAPWNASETGYYARKYIDESITNPNTRVSSDPSWPYFRYSEMLFNYAEAQYHLGNEEVCRQYLNLVRSRPSVNMPPITESGDELLERMYNDKFIEFAFEGHRYFDVRRWKIAPEVLNVPAKGISIQKDADGNKTYEDFIVEERNFYDKNYLVPIPQSEIDKNGELEQNPGY